MMRNRLSENRLSLEIFLNSDLPNELRRSSTGRNSESNKLMINENPDDDDAVPEARSSLLGSSYFNTKDEEAIEVPDMWSWPYIGLYCQYAAVGLLYGSSGALLSLCAYVYDGQPNLCANSANITFFAWNLKIVFAVITDAFRPFGMRRRPWMIAGWIGVLVSLLILVVYADQLDASTWLTILLLLQCFVMLSDVPADGYSVELGQLEPIERRGQILATGQMIRFSFSVLAGVIQAVLLNGPTTNEPGCPVSLETCWSFGLTVNQYYGVLFGIVAILVIPVFWLKELDATNIPRHTVKHFINEIWLTLQNLTTLYLLIYVIGISALTNFYNNANVFMQYYVIQLTNLQAGIDTITSYGALSVAIYLFKTYLINVNWRYTQYGSAIISSVLGLLWILVYYDIGGLQNPWFTIFIDLDTSFVAGISQVLFSLSVIELSKPGLEATTYELIITVCNAALTVSGIIATQLLTPLDAAGCSTYDDDYVCPSNTVSVNSGNSFNASDGPNRFTIYTLVLTGISIGATLMFTPLLPRDKAQCQTWKEEGERLGNSTARGYFTLALCVITVVYGFVVAVLLLNPDTSCLAAVGGTGC